MKTSVMTTTDVVTTKANFHWFISWDELGKILQNSWKNFEIFQNGPLTRGVIKEFIFSKIAWSPKSSTWEAVRAAKRPWKLLKWRI